MNIVLIDFSSVLHSTFHAESTNPDPNAVSTKVVARIRALASEQPHTAICCEGGRSFRKDLDPTYKAQRPEPIAELHHQGDVALDVLRADGFPVWRAEGYEADDVIATACQRAFPSVKSNIDPSVTIVSADKDLLQLVGPRVTVHSLTSGHTIDTDGVMAKFGVTPHQMVDYLSLVGDASDNIKGAKGIGAKGAAKLLTTFGNLDDLFTDMEDPSDPALRLTPAMLASLREFRPRAALVRQLITLKTDAPIQFDEIFKPRQPVASDDVVFDGADEQMAADIEETMQPLVEQKSFDLAHGLPTRGELLSETFTAPVQSQPPPLTALGSTPSVPNGGDSGHASVSSASAPPAVVTREVATAPQTPDVLAPAPIEWERQLEPRSLRECETLAKAVMASRLTFGDYGSHYAVMSVAMAGREFGMQFFAALRAFDIIGGRPTMKANAIVGTVLKSPLCEYFRCTERSDERATFITKRKGDPEMSLTFTMDDGKLAWAKDAKAWASSGWTKNPPDMLVARASSKLARLVYPDLIFNVYAPEEF